MAALACLGAAGGCGDGKPAAVPRFSPRAFVLANEMKRAIDKHYNGEAAGVLHEAERLHQTGAITRDDYETLRRVEGELRANNRNDAVRIFETALGLRESAEATPEELAAEKKALEAKPEEKDPKIDVLGKDPLPRPARHAMPASKP